MVEAALWTTLDALLASFRADAVIPTLVRIYDGPIATDAPDPAVLLVGHSGDPLALEAAITSDQSWAGIGRGRREESTNILCAIVVRSGSTDFASLRTSAEAIMSVIETNLRNDPTLSNAVRVAEITNIDLHAESFSAGSRLRVVFTVHCQARI